MSTISPYSNTSYYQLPGQTSSGTDSLQSASADSLAQILSNADSTSGSSNIDQLDLSAEAQSLLSGLTGTGGSSDTSSSTSTDNTNFVLTSSQQQQISTILAKYKNAPFTQATFDQIQSDLQSAGLGPDVLSAKDQINSFNPVSVFINTLAGNSSANTTATAATEQTKASNYIDQIYQQWQSISTTANDSTSGTTSA